MNNALNLMKLFDFRMSQSFYKTPLQFDKIFEGGELAQVNYKNSIDQSLQRLIVTHYGEHRFDPTYGCQVWDMDFELIVSASIWEEKLRLSILQSLEKHERRIGKVQIEVLVSEANFSHYSMSTKQVKKQVDIIVKGIILKTGEAYNFESKLYLSPLSVS